MSENVFDAAAHAKDFTRVLLGLLRHIHTTKDYLDRTFAILGPEQKRRFTHVHNACIQPSFAELMILVNKSVASEIISREEGARLREGLMQDLNWAVDEPK